MRLWLVLRNPHGGPIPKPTACPRSGCAGRRFRLHQVAAKSVRGPKAATIVMRSAASGASGVARGPDLAHNGGTSSAKDAAAGTVLVHRYRCLACGRTFRVYPAGVDRGATPTAIKRFAAALHVLGLPIRDISRALAVLGSPLGKSQVHVAVKAVVRGLRLRRAAPLLRRIDEEPSAAVSPTDDPPSTWIEIAGQRLPLYGTVDWAGRPALVIEGIDSRARAAANGWVSVLAGFGVHAEVDYYEPGRCGLDDIFRSAQSDSVGESGGAEGGADGGRESGDEGDSEVGGEDVAAATDGAEVDESAAASSGGEWSVITGGAGPPRIEGTAMLGRRRSVVGSAAWRMASLEPCRSAGGASVRPRRGGCGWAPGVLSGSNAARGRGARDGRRHWRRRERPAAVLLFARAA